jgi:hypothetical protein
MLTFQINRKGETEENCEETTYWQTTGKIYM